MNEFAIAAMGEDRPGMVARLGDALVEAGVSIEDSSMTILGGQFAMLLLVHGIQDEPALAALLAPVAAELGLLLEVRPAVTPASTGSREDYVIAAYGPDRPGLVVALARVLAAQDVNITDFGSRLSPDSVFAMWFNVAVPEAADVDALAADLRAAAGEVELDLSIHRADLEDL